MPRKSKKYTGQIRVGNTFIMNYPKKGTVVRTVTHKHQEEQQAEMFKLNGKLPWTTEFQLRRRIVEKAPTSRIKK